MRTELAATLGEQATALISRVSTDQKPVLITRNGVPAAYLVDSRTFETMEARLKILEGIAKGEKAVEGGRILDHEQARERMAKWLK